MNLFTNCDVFEELFTIKMTNIRGLNWMPSCDCLLILKKSGSSHFNLILSGTKKVRRRSVTLVANWLEFANSAMATAPWLKTVYKHKKWEWLGLWGQKRASIPTCGLNIYVTSCAEQQSDQSGSTRAHVSVPNFCQMSKMSPRRASREKDTWQNIQKVI